MGEVKVSSSALYGAQTQRAVDISQSPICAPRAFIKALAMIKGAAAAVSKTWVDAARDVGCNQRQRQEVANGQHDANFRSTLPDRFWHQANRMPVRCFRAWRPDSQQSASQ
jgi:fumarate hydratase class II